MIHVPWPCINDEKQASPRNRALFDEIFTSELTEEAFHGK
jgi:hypothetical protein